MVVQLNEIGFPIIGFLKYKIKLDVLLDLERIYKMFTYQKKSIFELFSVFLNTDCDVDYKGMI